MSREERRVVGEHTYDDNDDRRDEQGAREDEHLVGAGVEARKAHGNKRGLRRPPGFLAG